MFIWTISDVAAIIIAVILIGAAIVERIDSAWHARPHKEEPKVEPKPEPRDTTPKPLPKLPIRAWLILAVQAAVLIAIIWFVAHTLKI